MPRAKRRSAERGTKAKRAPRARRSDDGDVIDVEAELVDDGPRVAPPPPIVVRVNAKPAPGRAPDNVRSVTRADAYAMSAIVTDVEQAVDLGKKLGDALSRLFFGKR